MELTEQTLSRFKDLVYDRSHLSFPESREAQLRRWLIQRAEEGNYRSLEEYYQVIRTDPREFDRLVGLITTRETYFFRMPEQFQALREHVLPEIVEREGREAMRALSQGRPYRMRLRAWSAGCATGQEAYSLAIQALDAMRYPKAWDLGVIGTDINEDGLLTARSGRYDRSRLGKTPPEFLDRYFLPAAGGENEMVLSGDVRAVTTFRALNLRDLDREGAYQNAFDVIFCRNVMIYFDLAAQQGLVTALSRCLRPGGYLFTGEGEVLHLYQHRLQLIERSGCVYYRKLEKQSP
jgi:chemotaxis protein methyltransferase CheR